MLIKSMNMPEVTFLQYKQRIWTENVILRTWAIHNFVLVITCLEGWFGINCLSAFFEILKLPD